MAIPEHKFVSAHFTDNARTTVEVEWEAPDGKTRVEYIMAEEDNVNWKNLLEHISIDELHEATYKYIKNSQRTFEIQAMQIAKDQGLLQDIKDKNVINEAIIKILFEKEEEDGDSKNTLFVFKLKLFELEFVKNCKTKKLKSDLRKAKNIREALKVAIKIFEESN
jgi:hypothetical protein